MVTICKVGQWELIPDKVGPGWTTPCPKGTQCVSGASGRVVGSLRPHLSRWLHFGQRISRSSAFKSSVLDPSRRSLCPRLIVRAPRVLVVRDRQSERPCVHLKDGRLTCRHQMRHLPLNLTPVHIHPCPTPSTSRLSTATPTLQTCFCSLTPPHDLSDASDVEPPMILRCCGHDPSGHTSYYVTLRYDHPRVTQRGAGGNVEHRRDPCHCCLFVALLQSSTSDASDVRDLMRAMLSLCPSGPRAHFDLLGSSMVTWASSKDVMFVGRHYAERA